MHHKIKAKAKQIAKNPATKKALMSMKPARTIWGFVGVIVFIIAPEIIAFIWGTEITRYAQEGLLIAPSFMERHYYNLLLMIFEDGGSWFNIILGFVLLVWLFF
ncbi:hypothetical protein [Sulfuricurvum sp.]|uniref:hypothetical protein n=1 Tax=Sulfuricurvum sp. TaxID=2025608 RepID=UPI002605FE3D|nr:hypothetical protein [Sulfuricurvum sp.]MDD2266352.1 hypothetical protein [Sulfuricurvum sp.]MDD2783949.1 hypothetical protein [Sulfuricurvum sp.]